MKEILFIVLGLLSGFSIAKALSRSKNSKRSQFLDYEEKNALMIKELSDHLLIDKLQFTSWKDLLDNYIVNERDLSLTQFREQNKDYYSKTLSEIKDALNIDDVKLTQILMNNLIERAKRDRIIG